MSHSRTPASSSSDGILAAAAHGEHWRRRRRLTRRLSRLAPAAAGALLLVAAAIRLSHAPIALFWILSASAACGVALAGWWTARAQAVTDTDAARMDTDANLGGELRSAHWFASHPPSDAWTSHHLEAAAERVQRVSWPEVYPPVPASRAWAGSAVLGLAAIALAMTPAWPFSGGARAHGGRGTADAGSGMASPRIPADLQKQIDEFLEAVRRGAIPMDAARARMGELRDMMANLDPALQEAVAKAAQGQTQKPGDGEPGAADPKVADLASRAEKAAADAALPEDMKWSLEDLAAKLAKASRPSATPGDPADAPPAEGRPGESQPAAGKTAPPSDAKMMRMTTAEAQTNEMMASQAGPMSGDPQGRGAEAGRKGGAGQPLDLSSVLRKEAVAASADSAGTNVLAEIHRKSEQSHSTLEFSHVAPLAAYGTSHAAAPPPPPDALRPLVQQYFIRR